MASGNWRALALLIPAIATAQIAIDNAVDGGNNSGTSNSLSFPYTIKTSSSPFLALCLEGDVTQGGVNDVTSVTYGPRNLSLAATFTDSGYLNRFTYLYTLLGAPAGTDQIAIASGSTHYLFAVAASYANVSGIESVMTFPASSANPYATTWQTQADTSWMFLCDGGFWSSPVNGIKQRAEGGAHGEPAIYDSNGPVSHAAAYVMSTNSGTSSVDDVHIMAALAAVVIPPPPPRQITVRVGCKTIGPFVCDLTNDGTGSGRQVAPFPVIATIP